MGSKVQPSSNTLGDLLEQVNRYADADHVPKTKSVALAAVVGAAGLLSWLNPEDKPILVKELVIDVTTPATGAALGDFGQAATAVSSDNLLDGLDIGTAAILASNKENPGTNGKGVGQKVGVGEYITGTASADPAGLVGTARITYELVAAE